jgi:hypothetical protein
LKNRNYYFVSFAARRASFNSQIGILLAIIMSHDQQITVESSIDTVIQVRISDNMLFNVTYTIIVRYKISNFRLKFRILEEILKKVKIGI